MKILKDKQGNTPDTINASITLKELEEMQKAVLRIKIPDEINELADTVLCELRRQGIHISDRKFFGFSAIVQAKAFLDGRNEVNSKDLLVLKNYFWNTPEEIPTVGKVLADICENPIGAAVEKYVDMASEILGDVQTALLEDETNLKPYVKFSKELLRIYTELLSLKKPDMNTNDLKEVEMGEKKLEELSKMADELAKTPHIELAEKKRLNV